MAPNPDPRARDDGHTEPPPASPSFPIPDLDPNAPTLLDFDPPSFGADLMTANLRAIRPIGQGGMGQVLLAIDQRIGREVAVKELRPAALLDDRLRSRFLLEAKVTGRLEHPGIVPVYDIGTRPDGRPYYVMKLVRGQTLAEALHRCRDGAPEQALARRLRLLDALIDCCNAVAYAHAKGVIHRDLKPANIILGSFGETVILDWGLARVELGADWSTLADTGSGASTAGAGRTSDDSHPLTMAGEIMGTPAYMAPEQIVSALGQVDRRSDVFALGCILFQILTGRPPYQGSAATILTERRAGAELPPVRRIAPKAPAELAAICDTALAPDPAARFQDAGALARELRNFRDGRLVGAYAYSPMDLLRRFVARNRMALAAGVITLLAILVGALVAVRFALVAQEARLDAEAQRARAEAALVEITGGLQAKLDQARNLARRIRAETDGLALDLADAIQRFQSADIRDTAAVGPMLRTLGQRHPQVSKFVLSRPPGIVTAVYPETLAVQIGADISDLEHMRWTVTHRERNFSRIFTTLEGRPAVSLQYPWTVGGELAGVLAAVFDPGELIGGLLPPGTRDVWVMQEDGLILFSGDPADIGHHLLSDEALDKYPQLRLFARSLRREDDGIGHVEVLDPNGTKVNWMAAWATFVASELARWKVLVAEPRVVGASRDAAPPGAPAYRLLPSKASQSSE